MFRGVSLSASRSRQLFKSDQPLLEIVDKSAASGMSFSDYENIILKKNGRLTPLSVTASPLLLTDGTCAGTIVLLRDLTNIRELEEAVTESRPAFGAWNPGRRTGA